MRNGNISVLVIEDEADIRQLLRTMLEREGFTVTEAMLGRDGVRLFHQKQPNLVILDVGMPDLDGWQVLERIRDMSDVPVLMLTALSTERDKVRGLNAGADDYLTKPFSRVELLARIQAISRRQVQRNEPIVSFEDGSIRVDFSESQVTVDGVPIVLTPTEYRLLATLVRHQGQVLSSDQLIELAWDDPSGLAPSRVKYAVLRLRRKLGWGDQDDGPIETVRGFGYRYRARGPGERSSVMSTPFDPLTGEVLVRETPGATAEQGGQSGSGVPGFSGPTRVRLPLFALVALGTVLIGIVPFPHGARHEIIIALLLFFFLVTTAFVLPWDRLPEWAWLTIPIGYMAVIALIRDAQGVGDSELLVVYLLPIVWMSLYGRRAQLLVGLFCMDLALMVPVLLIGAPNYPLSTWRQIIVLVVVTTLVASTISTMVHRDRVYVSDLAQQSLLAKRNADDALNARERLETLLRAATGSAIMGVDPAGTVTFFSAGAELMLGYNASEVVGIRSIADFIDPAQITERRQTIDAMRKALDPVYPETVAEVPWTARRKNGEHRRCVVRVRTLPVPGGVDADPNASTNGGYVVVAIDVTEREELAAERERLYSIQKEVTQSLIEQNNRLRELTQMKDDVVATVSHELRTPITSIRGFIELLLDGVPELSEDQMRMLRTIDRNSAQLQRVAEDLLADPGGGHGLRVSFTELDLHQLAEESVHGAQTAATTAAVEVSLVPGPCVPVFGDSTRLHQLLGNLLSNAIKFSPRGGRVNVVVDTIDHFAQVLVQDEGPGIPEADRPQLFERFYRLAAAMEMGVPGTGLGLAIAKSVAEAHDGFVDIIDSPGWSTTFRVFLPLREVAESELTA